MIENELKVIENAYNNEHNRTCPRQSSGLTDPLGRQSSEVVSGLSCLKSAERSAANREIRNISTYILIYITI